ncbi:MAG TPA: hypothetical protein VHS52_04275 [Acidimicrobiales bacterium]|nr:hypothetical protein [Acidimicrobiales bacterium]
MIEAAVLTLEESARVAGHARWLETRLFEVMGSWVRVEPDAAAKVLWSAHSRRHATAARIWRDRQPRVAHLDPDALTVPAGPGVTALVDALAGLVEPSATVARCAAVARVVEPGRLAAYATRVEQAHPLADGPVSWWTRFLLADAEACRADAEVLLGDRVADPAERQAARDTEARLAACLTGLTDALGLTGDRRP